ncbi:MAG: hypothetical protein L6Q71_01315 [Planctomycetes bacterium]|nr:hypothetical protein [Planctomycetota bacterium]NUQ33421.1 hypothetical protein [Planctomycetaceae bacterium]
MNARHLTIPSALAVAATCAGIISAESFGGDLSDSETSGNASAPILMRSGETAGADAPSGRLMLRVPAKDGADSESSRPPVETGNPSVEPSDPMDEDGEGPFIFGIEIVGHKVVFNLDFSLSMGASHGSYEDADGNIISNASRLDIVKAEAIKAIKAFDDTFSFDLVYLAGGEPADICQLPNSDAWQGALVQCTGEAQAAAIEEIKTRTTWLGTPTYRSLERACHDYSDIDTLFVLSDGAPYPATPKFLGGRKHMAACLEDFPGWFSRFEDAKFICIFIGDPNAKTVGAMGGGAEAVEFMATLAASVSRSEFLVR